MNVNMPSISAKAEPNIARHVVLVLFPADLFYRQGEILKQADATAQLALLSGLIVTALYMVGLLTKKKPRIPGLDLDSHMVPVV